jgi:hypothetical protein
MVWKKIAVRELCDKAVGTPILEQVLKFVCRD